MPSPDDSFYNIKRLHVVFALSSAALLAVTVWMLLSDHRREWKVYQRTFQDQVEPWLTEAQLRQHQGDPSASQERERLERTLWQQSSRWSRTLLGLPLIDALGRPVSIRQIWLPELTIDYHFRDVARFDRCTTCHVAMDATQPGSAVEPACLTEQVLTLEFPRPTQPSDPSAKPSVTDLYGLVLVPGMLDSHASTVGLVEPRSPAARAGLLVGDVLLSIDGQPVSDGTAAAEQLAQAATGSESPIRLEIRRGLPQPYCSHPRLELFVGSASPHPMPEFGCTICHEGQGSATEFKFASHAPNDPGERQRWQEQYGWFWNRHWDLPMRAKRFTESSCLKCHHDVTDLEPSERFLDPPAPKLVEGYQLVRRHGCFGCHEIRGVLESGKRVGPDLRLEPNYHEAALQLLVDPALSDEQRQLARNVVAQPEDADSRHRLVASLQAADVANSLQPDSLAMVRLLAAEHPNPGTMRKVGPSLRGVGGRLDADFLESWIPGPSRFRPETRMPQLFAMHGHLDGKSLEDTKRLETVEVRAVAEYLLGASQPVPPLEAPSQVSESPSAERGKRLFVVQGCAACHKHEDVPEAVSVQGPALTNLGSKITTEAGRKWLVSWIRNPARHSPRTLMPNTLLEPVRLSPSDEKPRWTDPAADIATYLMESNGWRPADRPPLVEKDLDELALLYLGKTYPSELARQYLAKGIPESEADAVQGDARELVGPISLQKKLRYVGRRTIRKRGCFGCHDIPGFEDAQQIGPVLSEWGRKEESLLAFGQVHQWLARESGKDGTEGQGTEVRQPALTPGLSPASGRGETEMAAALTAQADREFYLEAVRGQRREGFVWQKLREPRSFDYRSTENKTYNEQLLMGRFSLNDSQREAIATFVLGLVADPPATRYVYQPDRRRQAIVDGRKILDKYGCAECHTLGMERWKFTYDPEKFEDPVETPDFAFARQKLPAAALAASRSTDRCGLGQAEVVGMPRVDAEGKLAEDEDDDGHPLYFFTLWEPAAINGQLWPVGGADVMISAPQIVQKRTPWGGAFARLLYPRVLQEARAAGSSAAEMEAWGWVPPPLVQEGALVEPSWLYGYLLNPTPIRPAAVLRMPNYSLSTQEVAQLVDYFAAASAAEFPYTASGRSASPGNNPKQNERLDRAMRLMTDRTTYCAKCHLIGDFTPGGDVQTILAPNLDQVGRRIRREYLRRWLANPKSVLPYTGMPANFPPEGPAMGQDLLEGTSLEQLDAVDALLLNYDEYLRQRVSVRQMMNVKPQDRVPGN